MQVAFAIDRMVLDACPLNGADAKFENVEIVLTHKKRLNLS